jgi:hypothetical protein
MAFVRPCVFGRTQLRSGREDPRGGAGFMCRTKTRDSCLELLRKLPKVARSRLIRSRT